MNTLKGYGVIDVTSTGGELAIVGGGLTLPSGTLTSTVGTIRYNPVSQGVELVTPSGVVTLGGSSSFNFLPTSGGTMTGPLTISDGQTIILAGNSTIDGVKPSELAASLTEMKTGVGFVTYSGVGFQSRTLTGDKGVEILGGDGLLPPVISIKPFALTLSGGVGTPDGHPVVVTFNGATDAFAAIYAKADSVIGLGDAIAGKVSQMVQGGTQTGMEVIVSPPGVLDFSAKSYSLSLAGALTGSAVIPANRQNVSLNAQLSESLGSITLRGSDAGTTSAGMRMRYDPASKSSYLENLSSLPTASLTFRTSGSGTSQDALTLQDGKLYGLTGEMSGDFSIGGTLTVLGPGIPGMVMTTPSGEVGLVWDQTTDTVTASYITSGAIVAGANFGKIAAPTQDFHVGDRAYNDLRYVSRTSPVLDGTASTQTILPTQDAQYGLGNAGKRYSTVWAQTLNGTVVSGGADLAERYHADAPYPPGTVVVFGGDVEITVTDREQDRRIAGVISTDPALLLNSQAGDDSTHPYLALRGRVPCWVIGPVMKGDLLVSSSIPGMAMVVDNPDPLSVLGKAIQPCGDGQHLIEIVL